MTYIVNDDKSGRNKISRLYLKLPLTPHPRGPANTTKLSGGPLVQGLFSPSMNKPK